MKYALELFLDPFTDARIRTAWDAIHSATGVSYMQASGAHPHVALTVFESEPISTSKLMDQVARCTIPSSLKPVGLGSFAGGVVFISIKTQVELLSLQNRVVEICRRNQVKLWEHYTQEKWVPHCTLMQNLPPDMIETAYHAISSSIYQCPWEVRSVGLITFPPTSLIEERRRPDRSLQTRPTSRPA